MSLFKGLATGIGSLPFKNAEEALDLVFQYCPEIPFWPQLPKLGQQEGMSAQFSEGLSFLKAHDLEKELEKFYEKIINQDKEYFRMSENFACGLYAFKQGLKKADLKNIRCLKGQITGPFTFAASLKDDRGVALLHDKVMLQVIIKGLSMKALWQIDFFKEFGKKMIIFVDEPYLGCFGSAYTPLNRQDVVEGLKELTESIKSADCLVGVHCCGNTDWSIFTEVKSIDMINFDAFSFLEKFLLYADHLKGFLLRGGLICWGIVPTQEFSGKESAKQLVDKLSAGIEKLEKKGLSRKLLLDNLLVSPACGLGTLEPAKAKKILQLLAEVSGLLRNNP